jgi:predicted membrane protein
MRTMKAVVKFLDIIGLVSIILWGTYFILYIWTDDTTFLKLTFSMGISFGVILIAHAWFSGEIKQLKKKQRKVSLTS